MKTFLAVILAIPMICIAQPTSQDVKLAIHYQQQKEKYSQEAAIEKIEIARRESINAGLVHKYPTPVDSAKNLYNWYVYKMNEADKKAIYYNNLLNK